METRHMEGQSLVSGAGMSVPMRSLEGQAWDGLAQSLGGAVWRPQEAKPGILDRSLQSRQCN